MHNILDKISIFNWNFNDSIFIFGICAVLVWNILLLLLLPPSNLPGKHRQDWRCEPKHLVSLILHRSKFNIHVPRKLILKVYFLYNLYETLLYTVVTHMKNNLFLLTRNCEWYVMGACLRLVLYFQFRQVPFKTTGAPCDLLSVITDVCYSTKFQMAGRLPIGKHLCQLAGFLTTWWALSGIISAGCKANI